MIGRERQWVRVRTLSPQEKAAIAATCEAFIEKTLKPRLLPAIRPTQFNYPIGIFGKWRASQYSFIARYRSGFPENLGEEFDAAFTRLDHVEEDLAATRFNVMWHRHTGRWHCLYWSVTLEKALDLVATDELLVPLS
jgi:hypothetical protein